MRPTKEELDRLIERAVQQWASYYMKFGTPREEAFKLARSYVMRTLNRAKLMNDPPVGGLTSWIWKGMPEVGVDYIPSGGPDGWIWELFGGTQTTMVGDPTGWWWDQVCGETCELACQEACQVNCQSCGELGICETTCEQICQTACQLDCKTCDELGFCETGWDREKEKMIRNCGHPPVCSSCIYKFHGCYDIIMRQFGRGDVNPPLSQMEFELAKIRVIEELNGLPPLEAACEPMIKKKGGMK